MRTAVAPFEVACPSCQTSFPVDPDRVPVEGVAVVCDACMRTFSVLLPEDLIRAREADEEVPAPAPGRDVTRAASPGIATLPAVEPEVPEGLEAPAEPQAPEGFEAPAEPEVHPGIEAPAEPASEAPERPPATDPEVELPPEPEGLQDLSSLTDEALAEQDEDAVPGGASLSEGAARFGRRDPNERARRLARVLVSDIIAYYPEKHAQAVAEGRVKETFEDEVKKSWKEYVDQVGPEIAESTDYFKTALNEVLARGRRIY